MRGLYSLSREYRKIFLRDRFPGISQILEGIHFDANTCRTCIRTRANAGKYFWRIIYVLVSCQGVQTQVHIRAQKGAKERFRVKIANNQVLNNQVWELPSAQMGSCKRGALQSTTKKGNEEAKGQQRGMMYIAGACSVHSDFTLRGGGGKRKSPIQNIPMSWGSILQHRCLTGVCKHSVLANLRFLWLYFRCF